MRLRALLLVVAGGAAVAVADDSEPVLVHLVNYMPDCCWKCWPAGASAAHCAPTDLGCILNLDNITTMAGEMGGCIKDNCDGGDAATAATLMGKMLLRYEEDPPKNETQAASTLIAAKLAKVAQSGGGALVASLGLVGAVVVLPMLMA